MKLPELRVSQFKPMTFPTSNGFTESVIDEDGKVVAVFFGKFSKPLAEYLTTFADAFKAAVAFKQLDQPVNPSTTAPDTALAPVEEVKA